MGLEQYLINIMAVVVTGIVFGVFFGPTVWSLLSAVIGFVSQGFKKKP